MQNKLKKALSLKYRCRRFFTSKTAKPDCECKRLWVLKNCFPFGNEWIYDAARNRLVRGARMSVQGVPKSSAWSTLDVVNKQGHIPAGWVDARPFSLLHLKFLTRN